MSIEQQFAKQLAEINEEFSKRVTNHASVDKDSDEPNLFTILDIEKREVLICRVLGALLNPYSKINAQNEESLKLFFHHVLKLDLPKECHSIAVDLEEVVEEKRRVDIVIRINDDSVYPIEVKIDAPDQQYQLIDYYHYYFGEYGEFKHQESKTIYYLTPTGKEPSSASIEKDGEMLKEPQYMRVSFEKDIIIWLNSIDLSQFDETAKFIIKQFKEVVEKMAEEYQAREALYAALGYTETSGFNKEEHNQLLLTIVDNHEDIKRKFQQHYICTHNDLDQYPSYTLLKVTEEEIKEDKYRVLKVMKEERVIAWICIATNLYIATKNEKVKEYDKNKWKKDSGYYWRHLYYNQEESSPIELSNIKKYLKKESRILIGDILKYCE